MIGWFEINCNLTTHVKNKCIAEKDILVQPFHT
jgi:hypothetical protein